jgi:hypothetical protein
MPNFSEIHSVVLETKYTDVHNFPSMTSLHKITHNKTKREYCQIIYLMAPQSLSVVDTSWKFSKSQKLTLRSALLEANRNSLGWNSTAVTGPPWSVNSLRSRPALMSHSCNITGNYITITEYLVALTITYVYYTMVSTNVTASKHKQGHACKWAYMVIWT